MILTCLEEKKGDRSLPPLLRLSALYGVSLLRALKVTPTPINRDVWGRLEYRGENQRVEEGAAQVGEGVSLGGSKAEQF